ncbi:MAG: ATP-binding protein [Candidatus Eisenbacteria bacterium]
MKEFSHPGSEEMTPTDINRALENTATVSKNEWKYVADLDLELDPTLPAVYCLPAELNQVFLNVIVNAAQAVGDAVRSKIRPHGKITVKTKLDGAFAEVRISDTGMGIPERARDHVFDPFYTTKEVGKGTGQGLAISRSVVVDKHHGSIDFLTCPGEGTTFIIRIPIDGDAARRAAA